jgi:hypothetical protein
MQAKKLNAARDLMREFGESSGLTSGRSPRRYLWTDAYAVCNYLALYQQLAQPEYIDRAAALVDQVHAVLGRHRLDDKRHGWISGLDDRAAQQHPTAGGLRIGKRLAERAVDEAYDAQVEWDRDGQYFHYLTKWMHALHQMSQVSGEAKYRYWASELCIAAFQGFRQLHSTTRLAWKMSIDLSYPLVPSSGHHDPLDGLISTLTLLQDNADESLGTTAQSLGRMCQDQDWTTNDALGIGGLLFDACRLAQLQPSVTTDDLLGVVLDAAVRSLEQLSASHMLQFDAAQRLGFRELGLAIGLRSIEYLPEITNSQRNSLLPFKPLAATIEDFWLEPSNRCYPSWTDHQDINDVMLATTLLSPAFVQITRNPRSRF